MKYEQMKQQSEGRYGFLSVLRMFFVLILVFYHLPAWLPFQRSFFFNEYLYLANDGFFCISGFLFFDRYFHRKNSPSSIQSLLLKKLRQLYPLHLFMLFVWVAVLLSKNKFMEIFGLVASQEENNNLSYFFFNLFFVHGWQINTNYSFNHPSWAISSLFFCYVVCAPLLLIRNARKVIYFLLITVCLTFGIMLFSAAADPHAFWLPRVLESFCIGSIVGLLRSKKNLNSSLSKIVIISDIVLFALLISMGNEFLKFSFPILISLLIWMLRRNDSYAFNRPGILKLTLYSDRLAYPIMISHSVVLITFEHLVIILSEKQPSWSRGTKYIELSFVQGFIAIFGTLASSIFLGFILYRANKAVQNKLTRLFL